MPSDRTAVYFSHFPENIERIERYTLGYDEARLDADAMRFDAVERCFQRLTEAAVRLGDNAERLAPSLPWRNIRAYGNHLRHGYDRLQPGSLWRTIVDELPPLKAACLAALAKLPPLEDD